MRERARISPAGVAAILVALAGLGALPRPAAAKEFTDPAGNPLPPMPPAIRENPRLLDPNYVRRYLEPGTFGLSFRAGVAICADWIAGGAAGCDRHKPIGGAADGAVFAHLVEVWKLSIAAGLTGGYRFDPSPLRRGEALSDSHLLHLGPLLRVEGDAGDWLFGFDAVPIGWIHRESDGRASGRSRGDDASFDASLFLGWRAWGHVPVGLYVSFFGPMGIGGAMPPGALTVGVFANRRFGEGRTALGGE